MGPYLSLEKLKNLKIEFQKSWNVRVDLILVVSYVLGTISEKLEMYLRIIDIPNDIPSPQKSTLLRTRFILTVLGVSDAG